MRERWEREGWERERWEERCEREVGDRGEG